MWVPAIYARGPCIGNTLNRNTGLTESSIPLPERTKSLNRRDSHCLPGQVKMKTVSWNLDSSTEIGFYQPRKKITEIKFPCGSVTALLPSLLLRLDGAAEPPQLPSTTAPNRRTGITAPSQEAQVWKLPTNTKPNIIQGLKNIKRRNQQMTSQQREQHLKKKKNLPKIHRYWYCLTYPG